MVTLLATELERRRELSRLKKTELIDWIIQIETAHATTADAIGALRDRVTTAYEDV